MLLDSGRFVDQMKGLYPNSTTMPPIPVASDCDVDCDVGCEVDRVVVVSAL